jgi:hypothetical protein
MQKIMVVARGTVYVDELTGEDIFADYMAVLYPAGLNPETTIFFNHEDIDKILFTGFSDNDEERFLEIYAEWKASLDKEKEDARIEDQTFGF